jgi:hypothetical protein
MSESMAILLCFVALLVKHGVLGKYLPVGYTPIPL